MTPLAGLVAAYLLGSIPFGWILPRVVRGIDIREHGSRNPGATNVGRVMGRPAGITVAVLDGLKGWVAVEVAIRIAGADPWSAVGYALAAVAGHVWPVWIGFRGGKGVITSAGAFFRLAPGPIGGAAAAFAVTAGLTRMISAGSIAAALVFPALVLGWPGPWTTTPMLAAAGATSALVLWRHRSNAVRILRGTESKFGAGKRR